MRSLPRRKLKNLHAEAAQFQRRAFVGFVAIAVAMLGLAAGYFRLQVLEHEEYQLRSEANRIKPRPIVPARGLITDRNGRLLADNVPAYRLEIVAEQVRDLDATLAGLAELVALDQEDIARFREARRATRAFRPVPLKLRLSEAELARLAVNRHRFPGVEVVPYLTRRYPYGELFAHIIGYVGRVDADDLAAMGDSRNTALTHIGKAGIERYYEDRLRGEIGYEEVETNVEGRALGVLRRIPAKPGADLQLTVDARLQQAMVDAFEGQHGAAVALDPKTGEILAMVSLPAYDPNLFINGISHKDWQALQAPSRPLFNRNVLGGAPPGSTIKPFMALAALEAGTRTPEQRTFSSGEFFLPGQARGYRDWRPGGHGWVDLNESLAQSVNSYYFQLAVELGVDRLDVFFERLGFGQPTGIDLAGEVSGVRPSRAWKRRAFNQNWFPGDTVNAAIGQGYWVTSPLQLARATAMLADGGVMRRPHLLRASQAGFNQPMRPEPQPEGVRVIENPAHLAAVNAGLESVMHGPTGTARATAAGSTYRMAGKTGTTQRVSRRGTERLDPKQLPYHLRHQAWFIGFAPVEAPTIAVVVLVEHGGSGSTAAAPVARRILDAWILPPAEEPAP
ncbi:MAG: penicillin-binding protein 2 [Arenimonas sp. SCN 70-307]|uniref:penicillin-binding protein 2 n=1 Tax=Arenimonas sp. SCN 70-307 TaxID=1660089 RepID=UPI00086FA36E|nr:penicillin-binding protein 2 [Arenimonas sp. SCN 70-307]ODS61834.1 MAG: penicillin-binding protein 2 [Arenimonas sp. SCN 70-307]